MTTTLRARTLAAAAFSGPLLLTASLARAQAAPTGGGPAAPTGAPPADAKALVEAPKAPSDAPDVEPKTPDGTTIALSAGGLLTTGNSRMLALTINGAAESRFSNNGVGASVLGNYGQAGAPGKAVTASAENIQGRLRYDRYFIEQASVFLIVTGRHDRFQGLDFRLNIDPGLKYLFIDHASQALWGEAGYDFQYDIRRNADRTILDANGNPVLDANGRPELLDKTAVDHSTRLFAGYRHAFNKEVTGSAGVEYLQSVVDAKRYRFNVDALVAAKIGAGFALGFGFGLRYDHEPLPGKQKTDTTTSASLIYAFSDVPEPAAAPTCPCNAAPEPPAAPPASSPPSSAPAAPFPPDSAPPAPPPPLPAPSDSSSQPPPQPQPIP